jgi:two-component system response regulator FixJ
MPLEIPTIYIVDDDADMRESIARLVHTVGWRPVTFTDPAAFLEHEPDPGPSCAVVDLRMPGMSGLDVQRALATLPEVPVVIVSGYATVTMAVLAMKRGAVTVLEKPFEGESLLNAIREALERSRERLSSRIVHDDELRVLDNLTPREHEVFDLVVQGRLNKQIAADLGISEKTVKIHRSHVMHKLGTTTIADLVRLHEHIPPAP